MKVLGIVEANLRRLMRDRTALFFTFLLPFMLILLLGLFVGGSAQTRVGVVVEDNGALGEALVASLGASSEDLDISIYPSEPSLVDAVERQRLVAGIVVPRDYSVALAARRQMSVRFIAEDNQYTPSVRWSLDAAIADQNVELGAAQALQAAGGGATFESRVAQVRTTRAEIGAVGVLERTPDAREREPWGQFGLVAAQELVLMVFLVALMASTQLVRTRELGVARRMLSTPTSARTVLAGEALSRFTIALLQAGVIVLVTALVFRVQWGDPLGAAAIVILFSLVGTGAAMLVGTLARNESQATAVGLVAALVLAAFGGSMQPLEFFSPTMRALAHITPHAWALDGFETLIRGGAGVADILVELGALAVFATVLLAAASWRLHRSLAA